MADLAGAGEAGGELDLIPPPLLTIPPKVKPEVLIWPNFPMKLRTGDGANEGETAEITGFEYFTKHYGKPKRANYLPLELCALISLQRYTRALSSQQRASLVEKSRHKPQDRIKTVTDALCKYQYDSDPVLTTCGISIEKQLTQFEGGVLDTPKLKVGKSEDCTTFKGRWNFNNKTLLNPTRIDRWIVVNFSARCDPSQLSRDLVNCGRKKGIVLEETFAKSQTVSPIEGPEKRSRQTLQSKTFHLQYFPMKPKTGDAASEGETADITVFEYFTKHRGSELTYSQYLPCLDVGKPKRPNYLPPEVQVNDSHSSLCDDDIGFRFNTGTTVGALLYVGGIVGFVDSRRTSITSITNRESIDDSFEKFHEISSTSHIYYLLCGDERRCSFLVKALSKAVRNLESHADFVTVETAAHIAQAHLVEYFKSNARDVDRTSEFGGVLIGWLSNKDYQAYKIMFVDGEVKDLESLHYTKVSDSSSKVNQIIVIGSGGYWGEQFFHLVSNDKSKLSEDEAKAIAKRLEYESALNDYYSGGNSRVFVFRHQENFNPTSREIHQPLDVQRELNPLRSGSLLIIRITPFAAGIYMDFEKQISGRSEVRCASLMLKKNGYNYYRVFCVEDGKNTLLEYLMQRFVKSDGIFAEVRYKLGETLIPVEVADCTEEVLKSIANEGLEN